MTEAAPIKIALVVAASTNNVIGRDGGLAWRIADDMRHFRQFTMFKPLIMGRKTFESIGKPLPGRDNIVITRNVDFNAEGVFVVYKLSAAFAVARQCAKDRGVDEICVIGGAEIYAQAMPFADRIYLTRVNADVPGDVYFPKLNGADWREKTLGGCDQTEKNQYSCDFLQLDRIAEPEKLTDC